MVTAQHPAVVWAPCLAFALLVSGGLAGVLIASDSQLQYKHAEVRASKGGRTGITGWQEGGWHVQALATCGHSCALLQLDIRATETFNHIKTWVEKMLVPLSAALWTSYAELTSDAPAILMSIWDRVRLTAFSRSSDPKQL